MLTKYQLTLGGVCHDLTSEHIRNWADVACAYARNDFGGIVRSFSSKFEFVGDVYDLLMDAVALHGVNTEARLTVLTINDSWLYEKRFEAPLDFSTATWDGLVFSISAVDDSLAALIKARKGTKYELQISKDIPVDGRLEYDRLILRNQVEHKVMDNTTDTTANASELVQLEAAQNFTRLYVYQVGEGESHENSPVNYADQSAEDGSYMLEIVNADAVITIESEIAFELYGACDRPSSGEIKLIAFTESSTDSEDLGSLLQLSPPGGVPFYPREDVGLFPSLEALLEAHPNGKRNAVAFVGTGKTQRSEIEAVYYCPDSEDSSDWKWEKGTLVIRSIRSEQTFHCANYKRIARITISGKPAGTRIAAVYKLSFQSSTGTRQHHLDINSKIKTSWTSRAKAVSIDTLSPQTVARVLLNKIADGHLDVAVTIDTDDDRMEGTRLLAAESIRGIAGAKFYSSFQEFCDWMATVFGYAYRIEEGNVVHFMHRSTLFTPTAEQYIMQGAMDVSCSIDSSILYNNVSIGYDKQDYDAECGRDEFNMGLEYATAYRATGKNLTLKSKYRADCYGIEFLAQKRAKDTTDDESDQSTFFVLCREEEVDSTVTEVNSRDEEEEVELTSYKLVIDRRSTIEGTISPNVFNGEFSPYRCLMANAGYIASMGAPLPLKFASAEGNSAVVIDGTPMSSNVTLDGALFTPLRLQFTVADVDSDGNIDRLIKIRLKGVTYSGVVESLQALYAREEAAKYKLIITEISA